jgi:ribosomal protein S1
VTLGIDFDNFFVCFQCTVEALHDHGIIVLLGKGLTGLIPKIHVADVPVKALAKKFKEGEKVKCRVSVHFT